MRVLVTGANGFLGYNLVKKLLECKHEVIAIDIFKSDLSHPFLKSFICDISNIHEINIDGPIDVVFHTAAKINFDENGYLDLTSNNILGSYKLAEFVIRKKIKKVVFSSSCSVYQENFNKDEWINENNPLKPVNLYATSKLVGEWISESVLKDFVEELIILRYSSIYGNGQKRSSILPIFVERAFLNEPLEIFGTGNRIQDYVLIDDVVQSNVNCLNKKLENTTILNIGSGEPLTDKDLAYRIVRQFNSKSQIKVLNRLNLPETYLNYSIAKAKQLIAYKPTLIEKGLESYLNKND